MSTIYGEHDEVITIPIPKEKFAHYCEAAHAIRGKPLTLEQKQQIFLSAIADFRKGSLALDELSEIAGHLWSTMGKDRSGEFADALYKCGELNFYIRHLHDLEIKTGNVQWFMTEVMDYFEKHTSPNTYAKRKKSIFLCASMSFYPELVEIEAKLKAKGFAVGIPASARMMKKRNDFEVAHFKGVVSYEKRGKLIRGNFRDIANADAILVINNTKNGVSGYIGTNVLMEIAMAFYFKKKIYIWNSFPVDSPFAEELACFDAKVIDKDLDEIQI